MSELDIVIQDWQDEIDAEAIILITEGTPPKHATELAEIRVATRRAGNTYAKRKS